ncbi:MAG: hypothetical protein P8170_04545 [Gemmatimonadota bacterium]
MTPSHSLWPWADVGHHIGFMNMLRSISAAVCLLLLSVATASAQEADSTFIEQNYTKHQYRIAMRDGAVAHGTRGPRGWMQ